LTWPHLVGGGPLLVGGSRVGGRPRGEVQRGVVRGDSRREGLSIRQLATRHGVHRRTVRAALRSAEPPPRKTRSGRRQSWTGSRRWWMRFDAFYCRPDVGGAHEKGGVEGEGGRFRRTHLVPVPKVATMAELNAGLEAYDEADDARRIANRVLTVGQDFALEAPRLRPLPAEPFEAGLVLRPRVDRHARVTVRQCHYSVPVKLIGQRVRVILRADQLVIFAGRGQVARHERSTVRGSSTLVLDHYLEVLARGSDGRRRTRGRRRGRGPPDRPGTAPVRRLRGARERSGAGGQPHRASAARPRGGHRRPASG